MEDAPYLLVQGNNGYLIRRGSVSSNSSGSSVDPAKYEVSSLASSIEERLTWRGRMQVVLHSTKFHLFIVALVVLDALIVLGELLLDLGVFGNLKCRGTELLEQAEFCHYSRDFRDRCAAPSNVIPIHNLTGLSLCTCKFREGKRVCLDFEVDEGFNPGIVLHGFSIALLTIFVLELLLKLIAFRLLFFTHIFEVFDAVVVLESFILDVATLGAEPVFEVLELVILLRLWRIVRIVNGAIGSARAQSNAQLAEVRGEARKNIHILHKLQERYTQLTTEKEILLQTLHDHNIAYE